MRHRTMPASVLLFPFLLALVFAIAGALACHPALASEDISSEASGSFSHPLDPLTKDEMQEAIRILKAEGKFQKSSSLVFVGVLEPTKEEILLFTPGDEIPRKAFAIIYDIKLNETNEAIVDLDANKTISWKLRPGVQPMQLEEDTPIGVELLAANEEWRKGLERRGVKSMDDVHMEMFVVGNPIGITNPQKDRLLRAYPYYRIRGNNSFGEPIEGLSALINLTRRKVEVRDTNNVIPLAGIHANYLSAKEVGELRKPAKPLITTQPEGPSFEIRGHELRWQRWRMRFELDAREGLVLHTVAYEDDGKLRKVLHRAAISEVSVPYGAPGPDWAWRGPIDEGEYGLGRLTTPLRPGHEVPSHATVLDDPYVNSVGELKVKPGAMAIWEQDGGILWEHHDDDADRTSTRRGRQLVIAHMFTLGNYDYFTQWLFNQDGSIEVRLTLNGDVLAQGVPNETCEVCDQEPDAEGVVSPKGVERYGTLVAPNIVGINHQHFFCFRLDFDVDGRQNRVYEMNVRPVSEGRGFDQQNTFILEKTLLRKEEEARRDLDEKSNRCWKVVNRASKGYLGHFPGYRLDPATNAYPYSHEDSFNRKRAGFLANHFWATKFSNEEKFAAGDYPTSSFGGEGLPAWSDKTSIVDEDVVVWYTVGITHTPRVEDWPVMPSAQMGFKIIPDAFFRRNPALDLPEAASK